MVAVILHLNPKALARGNALNVTILLVTFKADMNNFQSPQTEEFGISSQANQIPFTPEDSSRRKRRETTRIFSVVSVFANLLSTRHQLLHQTAKSSENCWLYPRPTYQCALGLGQILKRVKRFNSVFSSFVIS